MKLAKFLNGLFNEGAVTVPREIVPLEADDLHEAASLIRLAAKRERAELPNEAPEPDEKAALWAAIYLFRAVQMILLRDLADEVMDTYLTSFAGDQNAEAIYGIDLIFRHFGPVYKLGGSLAPADPLVVRLRQTAAQWPLSSVGVGLTPEVSLKVILEHPSLRYLYGDRVIASRDLTRTKTKAEQALLTEIMGAHQSVFWPQLELTPSE